MAEGKAWTLDARKRAESLSALAAETWDILVIGGGITGAGVALDAATRGLTVALIEMDDFAAGTSSRSTKLIHGGLRYLKQFEFRLVAEVGRERAILHRNIPHLVEPEQMLLPVVEGGTFGKLGVSVGLWVYDRLAGVKAEERRKMLSRAAVEGREALLRPKGLKGAGLYSEYRTDDARLTLEVVKTAARHGAICLNHLKATAIRREGDGPAIVTVQDAQGGAPIEVRARAVVNAAGPWADAVRKMAGPVVGHSLHHTKGVHIVVPRARLPIQHSIYFDIHDGRMMFAIPRGPWTYLGTTDTDFSGDIQHPRTSRADVDYLLRATNAFFPAAKLVLEDVVSSWAGIRPLIHEEGKSASQLSRKDMIFLSPVGMLTITGGKLTGYRKMAQRVTDMAVELVAADPGGRKAGPCITDRVALDGGFGGTAAKRDALQAEWAQRKGMDPREVRWLLDLYGADALRIMEALPANPSKADVTLAALDHSVQHEACRTLADFFIRRSALLYFGRPWIAPVLELARERLAALLPGNDPDPGNAFQAAYLQAVDFPSDETI